MAFILETREELLSLQNQVKALSLQHNLGKQNFHVCMKKFFEPVTKTIKDASQDVTKNLPNTSEENDKALVNSNDKLLELLNDRCIIESFVLSPLSKTTKPEHTSQFKLVEDPDSNSVNDLLIKKTKANTLYKKLLTFRDSNKKFELRGDLLKMETIQNDNVDLAF